jgi:hypothetical protein
VRRRGSARGKTRPPAPAVDDRVDSRPRRIRNEQARSRYSKRSGDPCAIDAAAQPAAAFYCWSPITCLARGVARALLDRQPLLRPLGPTPIGEAPRL